MALLWSAKESTLKALHAGLRLDTRSVVVSPFPASYDFNGWSRLLVRYSGERCAESRVFHGWWQLADNIVRTVVAAPPPDSPRRVFYQFDFSADTTESAGIEWGKRSTRKEWRTLCTRKSLFRIGLKALAGAAAGGLLLSAAIAGTTNCPPGCTSHDSFVDIRGVVTVNGVPTPGVHVAALCCDTGIMLNCTNADPVSTAEYTGSTFGVPVNYALSFNNTPLGGSCMAGCSSGQIWFGCYTPWNVELLFTYGSDAGCDFAPGARPAYEASTGEAV